MDKLWKDSLFQMWEVEAVKYHFHLAKYPIVFC